MESLNLDFLRNATEAGYGPTFRNEHYNLAVVQVEGTFTYLEMVLEGRIDIDSGTWETVSCWNVSTRNLRTTTIESAGIYEFPIEGVREFRLRIISISGGYVNATGVLYDTSSNTKYPQGAPNSITFGDPALFVKGVAEQIFFDPSNGNIVGYDKTATESSVSITVNLAEITGGMGNQLIGVLPDTARITGTYTSSAFSLQTREKIMGGEIAYNAIAQVCEVITADSTVLKVSKTPEKSLAETTTDDAYWCYVRENGEKKSGYNVSVDPITREVIGFAAEVGTEYEITYFSHIVSAQMLPIPTIWNPVLMTVQERYGVYAKQNGSAEKGSLRGWLYFIVPRAILNADAGVSGSQTGTADTNGSWIAIPEKPENMPICECDGELHPLGYYVYVPCSGINDSVSNIVSVGSGLTLKSGRTAQLPIKLVMPDDTLIQPDYSTLGYMSEDETVAVVDARGIVTAVNEGETMVHAYVSKSDGSAMDCNTRIVVIGTRNTLTANPNNILVG